MLSWSSKERSLFKMTSSSPNRVKPISLPMFYIFLAYLESFFIQTNLLLLSEMKISNLNSLNEADLDTLSTAGTLPSLSGNIIPSLPSIILFCCHLNVKQFFFKNFSLFYLSSSSNLLKLNNIYLIHTNNTHEFIFKYIYIYI